MGILKVSLLLAFIMAAINVSWADESFKIVTDPWPPYAYIDDDKIVGIDVDIALAVLEKMGIKGSIEMMPWKRSLASVKSLEADAILSAALTDDRKEFLFFPVEPISKGNTVSFQRKSSNTVFKILADLEKLRVGAMLGYKYCNELDNTSLLLTASRVSTLEQNFNKLVNDRIDLVVTVDVVGLYKAKKMGIFNEVSILKGTYYCIVENHLAFAKKIGRDQLAIQFSEELSKFKQTGEYQEILNKYSMGVDY
ncbi:Conserved hypothetical protein [Oleispira antarctica RB-8]|uniref:Solute-binding protein family 3/N-terminal domain-containing protein n=1 Tax=Oleispira antarctica RB-8 TaxID=698738 RepID=R4YV10_OLEAN|nr:Conserved hypothetical protein [Oleispira antarctica RB-8]